MSNADRIPDLIPLVGRRMVRASEPEGAAQLQECLIKQLTGGEPIKVGPVRASEPGAE